jgi:hypothetical protein
MTVLMKSVTTEDYSKENRCLVVSRPSREAFWGTSACVNVTRESAYCRMSLGLGVAGRNEFGVIMRYLFGPIDRSPGLRWLARLTVRGGDASSRPSDPCPSAGIGWSVKGLIASIAAFSLLL